jgi:hypothetical protein
MLTIKKSRWALSLLENSKSFIEKAYPKDAKLIQHLRDAIMIVCLKIQEEEDAKSSTL